MLAVAVDRLTNSAVSGRRRRGVQGIALLGEEIGEPDDRSERRPDLVVLARNSSSRSWRRPRIHASSSSRLRSSRSCRASRVPRWRRRARSGPGRGAGRSAWTVGPRRSRRRAAPLPGRRKSGTILRATAEEPQSSPGPVVAADARPTSMERPSAAPSSRAGCSRPRSAGGPAAVVESAEIGSGLDPGEASRTGSNQVDPSSRRQARTPTSESSMEATR